MNKCIQKFQINPAYLSDGSEHPVRIAAGKVLEENKLKRGGTQTVTKVPLVFKLLLLLVAVIAVIALVCSLLFYTGEVVPESTNVRPKQDPQAGFGLSNQELFDAIVALQKRVKELEQKEREDAVRLQTNINSTILMSKVDDANLDTKLQKNINATIDKCIKVNNTLTVKVAEHEQKHSQGVDKLQANIISILNMSKVDNSVLNEKLQKNINDTIHKCIQVNSTLRTRLARQEQKQLDDVTLLQADINNTMKMSKEDDAGLDEKLQKNITDAINKCMNLNTNLTSKLNALLMIHQNDVKSINTVGTKILHISCSSNVADTVELQDPVKLGDNKYACLCTGKGTLLTHSILHR